MTNEQIQALKGNQVRDSYYLVECGECGEIYPSNKLDGGCQIADTGDYGDCYCPHCDAVEEYEDLGNNAAIAWNYQQKRIDALLAECEADKALIAEQDARLVDYARIATKNASALSLTLNDAQEQFEMWAEGVGALPWGWLRKQRNPGGGYSVQIYGYMWSAWKASIEAAGITLKVGGE